MSFNKRFIKKDMIIKSDNLNYIANLVNADALMIDDWSDKFYKSFNFNWESYNKIRENLISDNIISSHVSLLHKDFTNLKSLSNIFLNLRSNPNWIDIHLANSILEEPIPDDISGKFDLLVDYFIDRINLHFQ